MAIGGGIPTNFAAQAQDQRMMINNEILMRGVQNQSLSKEEFLDLNADQNAYSQLRDTFQKSEGPSPEENKFLEARQLAYGNKLDKYREGDYKPVPNEATLADKELNEQAGKIYDGLKEETISRPEGRALLDSQRKIAGESLDRNPVDQQVDFKEQAQNIRDARAEKEADPRASGVPTPPAPGGQFPWNQSITPAPGSPFHGSQAPWGAAAFSMPQFSPTFGLPSVSWPGGGFGGNSVPQQPGGNGSDHKAAVR